MSLKSIGKRIVDVLKSKWVITIIGFTCLALLIWFGGPLVAIAGYEPLASAAVRVIVLLVIIIIWGILHFSQQINSKKQSEKMVDNLINGDEGSAVTGDDLVKSEIAVLQNKMTQALDILKHTKLTKNKSIYELPWYIMIGPPGSGKTTAIQHSGLEYPLKDKMGIDMIEGVGGTRHCDWWFTNKAVLIDTAGRYTTQDSHIKQDSRAWQGFLGLLKKYRPIRPINGVIISMGMSDLLNQTKTERNLHARAIKQRLQELQNQLGMTFPVYVLLSKSDLVAGFNEFFDDLTKDECEQIWGVTFPLNVDDGSDVVSTFNKEFHHLLLNLNARLNSRLRHERDLDRRAAIYEFPKQLRLLQSSADDFLKEIFAPNAYEEAPLLRGVYLTSATQEGTPIDHLSTHLSSGIKSRTKANTGHKVRSYFIKRLLEDVIFPEKNLASTNRKHVKHNKLLRKISVGIAASVTLLSSYLWWQSYDWNRQLIDNTYADLAKYEAITNGGLSSKADIVTLTKGLTVIRNLPVGFGTEKSDDAQTFGLYQGDKLKQPATAAYIRALETHLRPFMLAVLSEEMDANGGHLNYLYETLKTYLMLYQSEYYKEDNIKVWFSAYIDRNITGSINIDVRQQLNTHIETLLNLGIRGKKYDEMVVDSARANLTMLPLVERAYQRLKSDFSQSSIPDFKLVDILSLDSLDGLVFTSGRPFNQGIPGLYTFNGFHGIFNIEKNKIIKNLTADSWVYGDDLADLDEQARKRLTADLETKYIRDYIFYWEDLLSDVAIRPYSTLEEAERVTAALASPDQPIKTILAAVQKNVELTKLPMESNNLKAAGEVVSNISDVAFRSKKAQLNRLLPDTAIELNMDLPGKEVEVAFAEILKINLSEIDQVQTTLRALNRNYNKLLLQSEGRGSVMNQAVEESFAQMGSNLSEQLIDLPYPVKGWLGDVAYQTRSFAKSNQSQRFNGIWRSQVFAEFERAIAGRYPFNRRATEDVRLKDFSKFFGYGGTLDKFWDQYLAMHVDTSKKPWRFKRNIGIRNDVLTMYQRAEVIKEAFFEPGTNHPRINFSLEPQLLDSSVSLFLLEMDSQQLKYRHGPTRKEMFVWPGPGANNETRIAFSPPNGGRSINMKYEGEWSFFKLLDELSNKRPQTKKDGKLQINLSGYNAELTLRANSVNNPFWMANMEKFTCPANL
ncbi:type VI secretion system membrane subunit TssM [Shewanella sp. OMA3-2]|uniref:type VI secretion system membrane subunit TssM n=1 Tax=Shewanella sp. OMA3-2 TaxID=2908650 RepID=UPI001F279E11|nr:type VI secretion system membrane subunit TssM [Shewanella sp. OMA3-2]UJF20483.1 type VI secretion system membrane subunit TssM [Shewanella sp. OMA3-2]